MRVPFLNLKRQLEEVGAETQRALGEVLASGAYILGREVEDFEVEWARFCGARGAAGVGNGTDALSLALVASGAVRPGLGDEVITTPLTAGYTALAILNAGATPVFADIDPHTLTLNPDAIAKAVTPRARAVVPVHLYGRMADMEAVCEAAERRGLFVIEDAAQAHGASLGGRRAGSHGHAAAFSFYPTKNLGAYGDGGMVTSNDAGLIERVKELRQGGHESALRAKPPAGLNSRLDEMQAAALRVKLRRLEAWNSRRQALAEAYSRELSHCPKLTLPAPHEKDAHVFHLFVTQHPERERLREHLSARGVETLIHYPYLLHQQPLFRHTAQAPLPVAESVVSKILSLPLYPHLTEEELRAVASAILDFKD
jgi:dTDP-4-amino-4,6-dideoxygalactose transaminase